MRVFVSLVLLLGIAQVTHAHRPIPVGISCGTQFNTSADALVFPNPKISWSTRWIATCNNPILWAKGDMDKGFKMEFTSLTPNKERFKDVRVNVLVIGPGLPSLTDAEKAKVPQEVLADIKAGEGAVLKEAPEDQSTCAHLASPEMTEACGSVKSVESAGNRCHFHEPFGDSHSWVLLDENVVAQEAGEHRFAIWNPKNTPAKLSFACCAWPEDWQTEFDMPKVNCPYCGTEASNGAMGDWWAEQKSMAEYGGFPAMQDCAVDPGPPKLPTSCPPEPKEDVVKQPESCKLGCLNGECHSHNIFGECSYYLDWITPMPLLNGAEVSKLILFKGDKVKFGQPSDHQMVHNMFDLNSAEHLASCDFSKATELANVADIRVGKEVIFEKPGTHYFACGIACTPNMGESCHCKQGQVITVEVKDSSEGMRCHDHEHSGHSHDHSHEHEHDATATAACKDNEVMAYALGKEDYGAAEGQCSQMCASKAGLVYMAGVKEGTCADQGFPAMLEQKEVQPPGSPAKSSVTIFGKDQKVTCKDTEVMAYALGKKDYGAAEGQCSQMCASKAGLVYMAGVKEGTCADQGFDAMVEQKEVQPPGSPAKTSVTIMGKDQKMTCQENEVLAHIVGSKDYGAAEGQCSQMCAAKAGLVYMAGVKEGACADQGFDAVVEQKEVQPPGSPSKTAVTIMSKKGEKLSETCHCHSFEEIKCDAAGDALYKEHIDEITEHCAGVLDGTISVCPYKCFQPFEVLHLNYLECSTRPKHQLYQKIHATGKCHKAAKPAYGAASECPKVDPHSGVDKGAASDHDHDHDHDHDSSTQAPEEKNEPQAEGSAVSFSPQMASISWLITFLSFLFVVMQ